MKVDELRTERLVLRAFREDDLQFVFDHFSDPDVSRFLYDHEPPTTIKEGEDILKWCMDSGSKDHIRWCIEIGKGSGKVVGGKEGDIGRPIGTCGFHWYDPLNNSAEIGYDLAREFWGQGLMAEALRSMLAFGFDVLQLNRVYAYVYPKNQRSVQLLAGIGFSHEGVIREKHLFRGKYYDHSLYSLLRKEHPALAE
jgi:ribosomal-protein-alanine N-acetyltransferase